ncbi:MAG: VOC family protein [Verrucomicrobia bacterium]|nr:VOC family protein [Verrucomicrobiota bacterium]
MKLRCLLIAFHLLITVAPAAEPARPRIVGVSHAAFFVSDMAKARAFYEGFLGFQSPYAIPRPKGGELVWIKINDRQSVELFPGSEVEPDADRLYHIAVEVEDCDAMLAYLRAKGVAGLPPAATAPLGRIGNKNFTIKDPSGNGVEFVQYLPDGWTAREKGKFLPDTRAAKRMSHVGVMVGQLDASLKFYGELLGFKETWRGGAGKTLSWVNLRVPDGEDYVEFMLYEKYPTLDRLRTMHHICLEVPDVAQTGALLATRPYPAGSKPATPMKEGVNGKRQINYYDPDGTRVEIMEPNTADGKPRPPSTAPAPVGEPRPAGTVKP